MIRRVLTLLITLFTIGTVTAQESIKQPLVYIIPVQKMIEPALLYVIRRGVDEAVRNEADAIILRMDTTGGRVDAALAIISTIKHSSVPVYTYVEGEAISAGALIALCTPVIYMEPGSVIGDITPISLGLTGGVQDLPEAEKEKMTSYVAAHVRAAAERGGYDPLMAEAMVRADLEYKDGDRVIIPKGHVLTMTSSEAEQLVGEEQHPLLSKGTINSLEEMLDNVGLSGAEQRVLEASGAEQLARIIAAMAPILMLIGLGGLWLELKTPGFGIFGTVGISCLLLFFFGHHIAGLAGYEDILILTAGICLLALEIFVIPGFGIAGISGIVLILISLLSMMVEHVPGKWRPIEFSPSVFSGPLFNIFIAFIGAFALALVAGKFMPKTRLFHTITLNTVSPDAEEEGALLGLEGVTHSDLRPSGTAYFDGRKLDVVSYGDYIPRQSPVRIVEVHGNRIVVEVLSNG